MSTCVTLGTISVLLGLILIILIWQLLVFRVELLYLKFSFMLEKEKAIKHRINEDMQAALVNYHYAQTGEVIYGFVFNEKTGLLEPEGRL